QGAIGHISIQMHSLRIVKTFLGSIYGHQIRGKKTPQRGRIIPAFHVYQPRLSIYRMKGKRLMLCSTYTVPFIAERKKVKFPGLLSSGVSYKSSATRRIFMDKLNIRILFYCNPAVSHANEYKDFISTSI